jgi:hypothetical protein
MSNSRHICFVANFHKTVLFHELAQRLQQNGIVVSWVVTKKEQYQFLKDHYGEAHIIYINRSHILKPDEPIDDLKLNELAYGDRVFKHEVKNGLAFLTNIQKPLYDFILGNKIAYIVGEITWAHELVLARMVRKRKELNCIYVEPSVVRIPNNRFAFFIDETQNNILEFNEPVKNEVIKLEKPSYLKINDKIVKQNKSTLARLLRLKRFFSGENIEKNDPNVITNKSVRFKVNAGEELNKTVYGRLTTMSFEKIKNEKYIFTGFHKQPEASIDVSGRYHEDQFMNIVNLWRLLPQGWKLVMKEHTNAIGDRSYYFYKELLKYPNIVLADEKTNSQQLIEHSQLVVSVTGTIAYEAALLKKPAVTLSKVFFNRINYCKHLSIYELAEGSNLSELAQELKMQPDNLLEFSNYLMKNSFDGYITDPVTDISVLEEANMQKLLRAFITLAQRPNN